MHEHSRWIVAAAAAVLGAALAAPSSDARSHRHGRSTTAPHATPRSAPADPPPAEASPAPTAPSRAAAPPTADAATPAPAEPQADHSAYGKAGTPAIVLGTDAVQVVLGKIVRSSTGEDMGRLVDVVVDHDGQPRAAIIDFGGFLGIGTRKIAVDWRALNFAPAGKPGTITVDLTRNQVRVAPEYKRGEPVVVVSSASPGRTAPSSEAAAPER
jgi:hypothetical protein